MSLLSTVNKGHLRLWIVAAAIWVAYGSYAFGYSAYQNLSKSDKQKCIYATQTSFGMFTNYDYHYRKISEVPFSVKYYCSSRIERDIRDLDGTKTHVVLEPRYITFGRFLLIAAPPFLVPLILYLFNWVRDGYNN